MCGVLGYFSNNKISNLQIHNLKKASNYLRDRGPDYMGTIRGEKYFLSNSRLKIVSKKNYILPLFKHKNYISFSGEILNYRSLRSFLITKKYKFRTETDTEVILSLYDFYGDKFVEYLEGFFSICIFDKKKNLVILAVDRIGNKSLFYNFTNKSIFFSSEQSYMVKSNFLEFEINKKKVDEHVVFGDISGVETLHKNINKILPGQIVTYDFSKIKKSFWYSLSDFVKNYNDPKKDLSLESSIETMNSSLKSTIDLWSNNSAYEKSVLLSGGVDSGLVAMLLSNRRLKNKLSSHTAKFTGENHFISLNEDTEIDDIISAYNIKKSTVPCSKTSLLKNLDHIYSSFNEPLPSSSLLLSTLSQSIRKNTKERICFTGDGADEVFGGYDRHNIILRNYNRNKNIKTIALGFNYLTINRFKLFFNKDFVTPNTRLNFLKKLEGISAINKILLYDINFYLPIFLRSTEVIGMKSSIEYRSPFTDYKLIQESFRISDKYKLSLNSNKIILKNIFLYYIKKKIKKKKLFSVPYIEDLFRNGLFKDMIMQLTNNSKISDYYPVQGIKNLLKDNKRTNHANTLMRLLTLELFLQSKK